MVSGREGDGRIKDSPEEGHGENKAAVSRNRKSEGRAGLGGKVTCLPLGKFKGDKGTCSNGQWRPKNHSQLEHSLHGPPKDSQVLIPPNCECYLTWKKGLCRCDQVKVLRWEIMLDYPVGPECPHVCSPSFFFFFLAALGLHCCAWAFSSCGERGLLFVAVRGLLMAVASLVAEHGL